LIHRGNIRGRFITRARACSCLLAGRFICLPQSLPAPENKCPAAASHTPASDDRAELGGIVSI
jgi:hypothetical protein